MRFSPGDLIIAKKKTQSIWYRDKSREPELSGGPIVKDTPMVVLEVYDDFYRNVHTSEPMSDMLTVFASGDSEVLTGILSINYEYYRKY